MCLAIPGKILEIAQDDQGVKTAKATFGGVVKRVCLEYTPEAQVGDYVLVHVGFALGKVDDAEAQRTYRLLEEMGQLDELDAPDPDIGSPRIGTPRIGSPRSPSEGSGESSLLDQSLPEPHRS